MSRHSVIESSENGRTEIDYSAMPDAEVESRIHGYHEKYGMTLTVYSNRFSCGGATPLVYCVKSSATYGRRGDGHSKPRPWAGPDGGAPPDQPNVS